MPAFTKLKSLDQYLSKHLLCQLGCLINAADVHPALQAALELAQASSTCQDLTLHHNLYRGTQINAVKGAVWAAHGVIRFTRRR